MTMNLPSSDTGSTTAGCSAGCDRALAASTCTQNTEIPTDPMENSLYQLQLGRQMYTSSRSSNVIDLGVNQKPMYDFLLVTNNNFGRICYRFRDIDA